MKQDNNAPKVRRPKIPRGTRTKGPRTAHGARRSDKESNEHQWARRYRDRYTGMPHVPMRHGRRG
jgi:hypothetical protein